MINKLVDFRVLHRSKESDVLKSAPLMISNKKNQLIGHILNILFLYITFEKSRHEICLKISSQPEVDSYSYLDINLNSSAPAQN
ncbi:hypothetical protein BpHYR1_006389 [Brachionus plicatilis]|uniref:Uncharacterized protein n=1 Tax=Brachionus plicatilis TaxID=10195 RepID=A0A3M7R6Q4_BRAPC|nr:hypothetical protein BpHYR1_006389 [Brachionus plicatilis]